MTTIPLSTGLGEIMAPQTLITALIFSPDGTVSVEPGALHGRSAVEQSVQFVTSRDELKNAQVHWVVWVAAELDAANQPLRYNGVAASELWIDPATKQGYKVLAESVNRMAEAMRGGVNLKTLDRSSRQLIKQQLVSLGPEVWERSAQTLQGAFA